MRGNEGKTPALLEAPPSGTLKGKRDWAKGAGGIFGLPMGQKTFWAQSHPSATASKHRLVDTKMFRSALTHRSLKIKLSAGLQDMLEHLKWNLWHGKVDRVLEIVDELVYALGVEDPSPEHRKLLKAVQAFETYITRNRGLIPNYGERYRQGKTISTAFVESAVNHVVSKRFVKKQQMRWTPAGAHFLLQIRIEVLNGDWRATLPELTRRRKHPPSMKAA